MFIMENPIQMDDLVIFMVITPILGNLYMSKQMLSCTKLAATKSMAWSCDMTRPLLCHFRFRPQNRACGIPNSKRSFLSLSCWSNWSRSQYVTIVYNCHNAQALVLHVLLVLNHTVSSADHSCRIQRMGKQNTCNPKSACRTHTHTTSKGTASAWSVYSSRSYHSNRTVHWLFSAPATQASQPLHPGDSCSSSHPWQCHSWPQAAVKQTLRQKYKDSQSTGTAALLCFKFNMIIHRHSSFKDFWGVSQCWPNALHKFTTLRSFAPLWSRDRFRSFWLSKRENRQPPEWCCLKQNTRYDSIRFKQ